MADDPETLFRQGRAALPSWGEDDPGDERRTRALALVRRAAEAGHDEALEFMATMLGGVEAEPWLLKLAQKGDAGPLVSALTDSDHSPALGLGVLAAARAGQPWAMVAVGRVYGMGMAHPDGRLVATEEGAWGWLPGVRDPAGEGWSWLERAAATGWGPAHLVLGSRLRPIHPTRALHHLRLALTGKDWLPPKERAWARGVVPALLAATGAPFEAQLQARRELAEAGDADALAWLAARYGAGDGVARDPVEARRLWEAAARAGSVDGWRELGKMLEKGLGGPRDDEGARAAYEQAAELGADGHSRRRLAKKWGLTWYTEGRRGDR